ncbi:hypothetical protein F5Y10DRAFT_272375 [Nemania abortiva]|nr:hypothetical protein F5Y10DRAFT_272375 [Nemania abortiva]
MSTHVSPTSSTSAGFPTTTQRLRHFESRAVNPSCLNEACPEYPLSRRLQEDLPTIERLPGLLRGLAIPLISLRDMRLTPICALVTGFSVTSVSANPAFWGVTK